MRSSLRRFVSVQYRPIFQALVDAWAALSLGAAKLGRVARTVPAPAGPVKGACTRAAGSSTRIASRTRSAIRVQQHAAEQSSQPAERVAHHDFDIHARGDKLALSCGPERDRACLHEASFCAHGIAAVCFYRLQCLAAARPGGCGGRFWAQGTLRFLSARGRHGLAGDARGEHRGGLLAEGFWRLAELGVVGGVGRRRAGVAG
jgi:hypothetical protein